MKRLLVLACILLTAVGLGACGSNPGAQTTPPPTDTSRPPEGTIAPAGLDGSQWKLVLINGSGPAAGSYLRLFFRNGTIWGYSGLNIYGGLYRAKEPDRLVFSDVAQTALGGPENLIKQEGVCSQYFRGAASYRLDDNSLQISTASMPAPLVFSRLPEYAMDPAALVGTRWQLVSLNGESVLEALSITLSFDSDSHASGRAGDFVYELNYQAAGDDIRWGISVRREGDIAQEVELQAARYTSVIAGVSNYRLTDARLEVFTIRGETLVFAPLAK